MRCLATLAQFLIELLLICRCLSLSLFITLLCFAVIMATSKQGTLDDDKQTNRTYPHSLQGMLQYCAEHTEPESTSTTQLDAQTDVQAKSDTVLSNIDDEVEYDCNTYF